jgi:serine/threonine protein kinase
LEIVGKAIGRFEIAEMIGEGGMAKVYRAYDPEINRSVALKILKDEHCSDEEHNSRFINEGKAAGALTHPNIVTIYDVGKLDNVPYIIMELLEGENLGDILRAGERISLQAVIDLAIEMAGALGYAHKKGVIHRDLKPDNIMMGADGASAKITDFGIARMEEAGSIESTQVGMMLGTPRYMSPEQACGTTIDGRSDLFTLGVIMYELITGQKAFTAESIPTLIKQIVDKDPTPIRQINSQAPPGLQRIVAKLLQKKPEKRFQSGAELLVALERERFAAQEKVRD